MRGGAVLGALVFLVSFLAACAVDSEANSQFAHAAEAEIARHPDQYSEGEARTYLVLFHGQVHGLIWGSVHVNYGPDTMPPQAIRDRLNAAVDLTMEWPVETFTKADQEKMDALRKHYVETPSEQAVARLDPDTRAALARSDVPSNAASQLSLRGLSAVVTAISSQNPLAYEGSTAAVDNMFAGFSRKRGSALHGLDTREEKLAIFDHDPNDADSAAELRLSLRRAPQMRQFKNWLFAQYGQGHIASVVAAVNGWAATTEDRARNEEQTNVTARNALWLPKLDAILRKPGFHFVIFGAAHLLGKRGIVALLRSEGWEVLPCVNDVCPAL